MSYKRKYGASDMSRNDSPSKRPHKDFRRSNATSSGSNEIPLGKSRLIGSASASPAPSNGHHAGLPVAPDGQYHPRPPLPAASSERHVPHPKQQLDNQAPLAQRPDRLRLTKGHSHPLRSTFQAPAIIPALPPIRNHALATAPFTHIGSLHQSEVRNHSAHYERLEFLGDAYIEVVASRLVYTTFPTWMPGQMSQVRESLVRNETLARFSMMYGFDEKLSLPRTFMDGLGANEKKWQKTLGDVFEAYVAAVVLDDPEGGFATAEKWLTELWQPSIDGTKRSESGINATASNGEDALAKQNLAKKIMGKGCRSEYRQESAPCEIRNQGKAIYHVGMYFTGWGWTEQWLGSGKGSNLKEAGMNAALKAMGNPLTAKIAAVKAQFNKEEAERREREDKETEKEEGADEVTV